MESSDQVPPTEEGDQQQTGTVVNGHDYLEGWTEEMEAVKTPFFSKILQILSKIFLMC